MKIFSILILSLTSLGAWAGQNDKGGLTAVEREPCMSFPALKPVDELTPGADYVASHEYDCDDDDNASSCRSYQKFAFKYNYLRITRVDYYSADGKLVTSKESKDKYSIDESIHGYGYGEWKQISFLVGYEPVDDEAKAALNQSYQEISKIVLALIRKNIGEATDICDASYYR
jgi:hypothetical protein